ncbi:hypothetical protein ABZ953_12490 [Streptomyces sp. NPDC046465]|uniref:hypothetical protein n=1 Tax=Streptomyces sp. NPDC046465 TaxID=3155810 RepID=UPI0033CE3565
MATSSTTTQPTQKARTSYRRRLAAPVLLLGAALSLTGCGDEGRHPAATAPGAPAPGTPAETPSTTPSSTTPSPGASPYVEPGVVDGAPHNGENNAYRRPGEMSAADEKAARTEAARMKPVLKQLWRQHKWDPESVRAALTGKLGYEIRETTDAGTLLGGELDVQGMSPRYENGESVTPECATIGLYVGDHACVTAFVQKTNYSAQANGRFPETGCLTPPSGH